MPRGRIWRARDGGPRAARLGAVLGLLAAALLFAFRGKLGLYLHFLPYYLAGPAPQAECGEGPGFRYCLHRAPAGAPENAQSLLYFLHYGGGDERSWAGTPMSRAFYAALRRRGLAAPRVVSLSYGAYWTLFDKPGALRSPLFRDFIERAMPWIESRTGAPRRRYLWGMSQGGLNAALLGFKRPRLWSKIALSCPALYTVSVFAGPDLLDDYARRHYTTRVAVDWAFALARNRSAGPEEWVREDPLMRAFRGEPFPPARVDCNAEDEYGFCDGAKRFVQLLKERGSRASLERLSGGHCRTDPYAVAEFLAGP